MNRVIARTLTALAAACVGLTLVGGPTQAAPPPTHRSARESTAPVRGDLCHNIGTTNYYVHHWQPIHAWQILNSPYVFIERRCLVNGFRLYKSTSDTEAELRFARHFLATDRPKKPTIFCRTTPHHAYFLDLRFYWADIAPLNAAERHHYTAWAHAYADRHGCHLFLPRSS